MKNIEYECPVCKGQKRFEVHQGHLPWDIDCENCNGTGKCDWVRYARPLPFDLWKEIPE